MFHSLSKNMQEPDSVMKESSAYCLPIMPTNECKLLPYTSDDKTGFANHTTTVDKKNIICKNSKIFDNGYNCKD